jgi:hypothetical protein
MPKTKTFCVAVEGPTVDGRVIERNWLIEGAASYNRATYGARVNMEHIRGVTADKPFKAYGDVLAFSTGDVEIELAGKKQKKLGLFAEIEAHDDLVAMTAAGQKVYTSIEVQPDFASTGKAYIVGLAVTDSPASLGTDILTFAVQHPGVMRNGPALQAEGNVFSLGHETRIEFAEAVPPAADSQAGLLAAATGFFKQLTGSFTAPVVETPAPAPTTPPTGGSGAQEAANDNDPRFAIVAQGMEKLTAAIGKIGEGVTALRSEHDALKASVEATPKPGQTTRSLSTGGNAAIGAVDF